MLHKQLLSCSPLLIKVQDNKKACDINRRLKVEVAGTEPNLFIPLISLIFQTLICQVVSDFNHLTAIAIYKLLLYLYLYTELPFQSFHGAFRYISEFCNLSDWIARSQKFEHLLVFFFLGINRFSPSHLTTKT